MKQAVKKKALDPEVESRARLILFWSGISLLVLIPLVFSTDLYRSFALPKFALLLIGSSTLIPLLALTAIFAEPRRASLPPATWSTHAVIVCLYVAAISLSTVFGVAPLASLFGSTENQMGLITISCFLICFFGLLAGIDASEARLKTTLAAIAITGLLVAAYAFAQFFGRDPFQSPALYTLDTVAGTLVRVTSTLGHADYLGNFLLYTTPLSAGLALVWRGGARAIASVGTVLSIAAIAISGTRGAWLGIALGAVVFVWLETKGSGKRFLHTGRKRMIQAAIAAIAILISIWVVSMSPASNSISLRASALISEGWSGSGRTLLWHDSIRMVPAYAVTGCGPEGFRKAFLVYKSKELARLAPQTNNESSHNSYLDAAISYGLAGAISYVALIASSFLLLIKARRRAMNPGLRVILTAMVSSLAAVVTHNFFIFDQIPTRLYFFAFAALAQAAMNVTSASIRANSETEARGKARAGEWVKQSSMLNALQFNASRWPARLALWAGCVITVAALWYSIYLIRSDVEITKAFASASAGDFDRVVEHGNRAIEGPEPTGAYNFLFARALALCTERMHSSVSADRQATATDGRLAAARVRAIEMAARNAERSIKHTLTPDSSYLLLAYLALAGGDIPDALANASEAIKIDPNYSNAHRLLAEAHLAEGDLRRAAQEAELSVELDPYSPDAVSVFRKTHSRATVDRLIERGRALAKAGKMNKARRTLLRAVRRSTGPCPECHRQLSLIYEESGLYEDAIAEWQMFMRDDPARAAAEQSRIETLRQKAGIKQ